jgi:hypothetical protein
MPAAQVAVADYCPDWWPAATTLLIRRVRLDVAAGQVSADPRSRRRRTLQPDQRALPISELADANAVYGHSFIVTNLDVSTPERAAAVELTATPAPDGALAGHGVRGGQAMIATLRHRLIRVPARLIHHTGALHLRLPPGQHLLEQILTRLRALPATP